MRRPRHDKHVVPVVLPVTRLLPQPLVIDQWSAHLGRSAKPLSDRTYDDPRGFVWHGSSNTARGTHLSIASDSVLLSHEVHEAIVHTRAVRQHEGAAGTIIMEHEELLLLA